MKKVCIADNCKKRNDCVSYMDRAALNGCGQQIIVDPLLGVPCFEREARCDHIVCLEEDYNEGHGEITDAYVNLAIQSESVPPGHSYGHTYFKFCPMCGMPLTEFAYRLSGDKHDMVFRKVVGIDYVPKKNEIPYEDEDDQ